MDANTSSLPVAGSSRQVVAVTEDRGMTSDLDTHDEYQSITSNDCEGHFRLSWFPLESDHTVTELVDDLVNQSVIQSQEAFYARRLKGYVAKWLGDRVMEVICSALVDPMDGLDQRTPTIDHREDTENTEVVSILRPPPSSLSEPRPSQLDICCRHGIPLRPPDSQPSSKMMELTFATSDYHVQRGCRMRDSPSRTSSLASFQMRRKPGTTPPASPRTSASFSASAIAFTGSNGSEVHAPGVVFSTAPRVSPRKAMTLLKTATRMSAGTMAPASCLGGKATDQDLCSAEMKQEALTSAASTDDDASSTSPSLERHLIHRKRTTRQQDARGNEFTTAPWDSHDEVEHAGDDDNDDLDPYIEHNTPIQVEFVVRRGNVHSNCSSSHANLSSLPPLSPSAAQKRRPSRISSMTDIENEHGLLGGVYGGADAGRLSRCGGGERMGDEDTDDGQFQNDPLNLHRHLQSMVLAPGVRLQTGIETKNGPDLPAFPTRMRKVTFYRSALTVFDGDGVQQDDAIERTLSTHALHTTLLVSGSSASLVSSGHHQHPSAAASMGRDEDRVSSYDIDMAAGGESTQSSHHPCASKKSTSPSTGSTTSSWTSAASSATFRRISKVQRPCTTPGGDHTTSCSVGGSGQNMAIDRRLSSSFSNCNGSQTSRAEDFKELVKQRAFIRKKPSFSFATSPFKKRTVRDKDQHLHQSTKCTTPPMSRKNSILFISLPMAFLG